MGNVEENEEKWKKKDGHQGKIEKKIKRKKIEKNIKRKDENENVR